jgi:hypothetical protein
MRPLANSLQYGVSTSLLHNYLQHFLSSVAGKDAGACIHNQDLVYTQEHVPNSHEAAGLGRSVCFRPRYHSSIHL